MHCPVTGQAGRPAPQALGLRSHSPRVRSTLRGFWQSPSQASPMPSPSVSLWSAFGVRTQLSFLSAKPSPSRSAEALLQASPLAVPPACTGL